MRIIFIALSAVEIMRIFLLNETVNVGNNVKNL